MPKNPPLPGARPGGSKASDAGAAVSHLKLKRSRQNLILRRNQVHALRHGTCSQSPFQQPRAPSGLLGRFRCFLQVFQPSLGCLHSIITRASCG